MNREEEVNDYLVRKASTYVNCASEGGRLECDFSVLRFVHREFKSEQDRNVYKMKYLMYVDEFQAVQNMQEDNTKVE
jgi:hypothetical protein